MNDLWLLKTRGYAVLESAIAPDFVERMREALGEAYAALRPFQVAGQIGESTVHTVHHLPALGGVWLDFLRINPARDLLQAYFTGPYVLNSMGGNFNPPDGRNYASKVHRDSRHGWLGDRPEMVNTLVTLDQFTPESGATWLLPYSQGIDDEAIVQECFDDGAIQIVVPAGSVVVWDSRLWHRAGENRGLAPRRIITPIFTRPWLKQGFDYPRAVCGIEWLPDDIKQVLGYFSRTPATFEEWYRPGNRRLYRSDQG